MKYFSLGKGSKNEKSWRALLYIEEGDRRSLRNVIRPPVPVFEAAVRQVPEEHNHDTDCRKDIKLHVPCIFAQEPRGWLLVSICDFFANATTCPLWSSWTPLPVVAEV
jgi:hypothetical protein